jgi:hypothetical protein
MAAPVTIASDTLPTAPNTSYIVWETSTAGVYAAALNFQGFTDAVTVSWALTVHGLFTTVWSVDVDAATTNVLTPPIPVASYGRVTARTGNAGTAEIEWEVIGT